MESTTIWSFPDRGNWATHAGKYRGNRSLYVPRNLILRYSKPRNWVLDHFVGSGTTLVEAKLLNRNAVGVISIHSLLRLRKRICDLNVKQQMQKYLHELEMLQICTHPPYAGIIRYSKEIKGDVSLLDMDEYLDEMQKAAAEAYRVLKKGKMCAVMIGDIRKCGSVGLSSDGMLFKKRIFE